MRLTRNGIVAFRLAAAAILIAGLICRSMKDDGLEILLYFTIDSNLLGIAVLLLGAISVMMGGKVAPFPTLSFVSVVALILTFIIYWSLLAAVSPYPLLEFYNISEHLLAPIFLIVDRLVFYVGSAQRNVIPALVFPFCYMVVAITVGYCHVVSFHTGWYPYTFLDIETHGAMVIVYMIAFVGLILLISLILARYERNRDKKLLMRALSP